MVWEGPRPPNSQIPVKIIKKHDNSVILHKNIKFCVFIEKVGKILKESVFGGDGPPKTIEIP